MTPAGMVDRRDRQTARPGSDAPATIRPHLGGDERYFGAASIAVASEGPPAGGRDVTLAQ